MKDYTFDMFYVLPLRKLPNKTDVLALNTTVNGYSLTKG